MALPNRRSDGMLDVWLLGLDALLRRRAGVFLLLALPILMGLEDAGIARAIQGDRLAFSFGCLCCHSFDCLSLNKRLAVSSRVTLSPLEIQCHPSCCPPLDQCPSAHAADRHDT